MPETYEDLQHISPQELADRLTSISPGTIVTRGHYEIECESSVADLDWNHMDGHHRPTIHRTYTNALRLCSGRSFQLSMTRIPGTPFLVTISDVRVAPGLFYQSFSMFSALAVTSVIRSIPNDNGATVRIDWYIASKKLFRFLHPWLNRRLARLNRVQNMEDMPIRNRRRILRQKGYHFQTDIPDFLNSNDLTTCLRPPTIEHAQTVSLTASSEFQMIDVGGFEIIYRLDGDSVDFWPGACPHEGASLIEEKPEGNVITCPWHSLKIKSLRLSPSRTTARFGHVTLELRENSLTVYPGDRMADGGSETA